MKIYLHELLRRIKENEKKLRDMKDDFFSDNQEILELHQEIESDKKEYRERINKLEGIR